jgi:hypothetical protein
MSWRIEVAAPTRATRYVPVISSRPTMAMT